MPQDTPPLNKHSKPLVSIIVPVYNGADLISKTTHNLLQQSYQNIELILVNDGSTDDSGTIINELAKLDYHVKSFHKTNGGIASARNYGILKASGKFIALCDQDDFWNPEKLTKQMPLFDNPNTGLVFCGEIIERINDKEITIPIKNKKKGRVFQYLIQSNFIGSLDTVIRKTLLKQVNGFDPDRRLMGVDDWHLWLKLSLITEFDYVPEALSIHVTHGNNYSKKEDLMHQAELICIEKIRSETGAQQYKINWQNVINTTHQNYLNSYINNGDLYNAKRTCKLIIDNKPLQLLIYFKQFILTTIPYTFFQQLQNIKRKITST